MSKLTITKRYRNLKAAHRQWRHRGHCSQVHGENWGFDITLEARELDSCGFIMDFGRMGDVKDLLDSLFDHVLLIDLDDPEIETFRDLHKRRLIRLIEVPSASAEGLAKLVYTQVAALLWSMEKGRVIVSRVVCYEDDKNSAEWTE